MTHREIKFRLWDNLIKRMYGPGCNGNYYADGLCRLETDSFGNFTKGHAHTVQWDLAEDAGDPDPAETRHFDYVLMQFTGQRALIGRKEIYEGDLMRFTEPFEFTKAGELYQVEFGIRGFRGTPIAYIYDKRYGDYAGGGERENIYEGEVVGNIYENRDLIIDQITPMFCCLIM